VKWFHSFAGIEDVPGMVAGLGFAVAGHNTGNFVGWLELDGPEPERIPVAGDYYCVDIGKSDWRLLLTLMPLQKVGRRKG